MERKKLRHCNETSEKRQAKTGPLESQALFQQVFTNLILTLRGLYATNCLKFGSREPFVGDEVAIGYGATTCAKCVAAFHRSCASLTIASFTIRLGGDLVIGESGELLVPALQKPEPRRVRSDTGSGALFAGRGNDVSGSGTDSGDAKRPETGNPPPVRDDRSPIARGLELGSQVTAMAATLAVAVLLGHWLDQYLGTRPLFILLGMVIGGAGAALQFSRLVKRLSGQSGPGRSRTKRGDKQNSG